MANIWGNSLSNELGRLAQGIRDITGNDVIDFITKAEISLHKKVTYANMVCDYRPLKSDPYRVRLTVGGDKLDYFDDAASPVATLLETKLLLNSVISGAHKGARFMTIDIKDFFLQTFMKDAEYMRIHSKYFLNHFCSLFPYYLKNKFSNYKPFSSEIIEQLGMSEEDALQLYLETWIEGYSSYSQFLEHVESPTKGKFVNVSKEFGRKVENPEDKLQLTKSFTISTPITPLSNTFH